MGGSAFRECRGWSLEVSSPQVLWAAHAWRSAPHKSSGLRMPVPEDYGVGSSLTYPPCSGYGAHTPS